MFVSFAIGFVGVPFLGVMLRKKKEKRSRTEILIGILMIGQLILTWAIGFGAGGFMTGQARREVLTFLNKQEITVEINNKIADSVVSQILLYDLSKLRSFTAHHSFPTDKFEIVIIRQPDTLRLSIEKDSNFPQEYWYS